MKCSDQPQKQPLPLLSSRQARGGHCLPIAAALLVTGLTACSPEKEASEVGNNTAESANSTSLPSMYVDRTIETLTNGVNKSQSDYQDSVSVCESAGVPTTTLNPEEVDKIGTKRWQFWRMPGQMAYKVEAWTLGAGDVREGRHCEFYLALEGGHAYFDNDITVWLDLATGERAEGAAKPQELQVLDASPTDNDWVAWQNWGEPTNKTVAGQPCKEWRSPRGDVTCYWSGGTQWGFSYMPSGIFASNAGFPTGEIVLRAEPAPNTVGERLTTEQFILDGSFDPQEMQP